jgi:uncharacterized cupredoxin-like copper-binding protein
MTPSKIRRLLIALLAVFALLLAACGDSDSDSSSDEPETTEAADSGDEMEEDEMEEEEGGSDAATEATVESMEFNFAPNEISVAADTDVTVTLDNTGSIPHNWTVMAAGVTLGSEADFDAADVAVATADVDGGASATVTVNLAAGEYQVICSIPGHFDAGMRGTLTVG